MSELDTALRAVRAARTGVSAVIIVEGEPGIGKTAFAGEVAEQAHRLGYTVGAGTAAEHDNVAPLVSLGAALRTTPAPLVDAADFADLAPLLEQPLWLAERLCELLTRRANAGPLLVLLDDVHWADPLSVFMLRVAIARLADRPIAWLLAGRPIAGGPADQVVAAASQAVPVHRITLPPLTADALLDLAADRLGGRPPDHLGRRLRDTGGLPFLAVHITEGLVTSDGRAGGDLPAGLVEGVRRRAASLSSPARAFLRVGVVLGGRFFLPDVATLSALGVTELTDPLTEAIDTGFLVDDGDAVTFRHDLLRQALYQDVPPSARRALHHRIADHFLDSGRGAAEAAPHVLATAKVGDARAVWVLREAAHEILATMAVTSVEFIKRAFALVDAHDPQRAEVGREVVTVLVSAYQFDEALAFTTELLREPVPPDIAVTVRLALTPWLWAAHRYDELLAWTAEPLTAQAAPELRARLAAYRALATGLPGDSTQDDPVARAVLLAARGEEHDRARAYRDAVAAYRDARLTAEPADGVTGRPPVVVLALCEVFASAHAVDPWQAQAELEVVRAMPQSSWYAPRIELLSAQLALGLGRVEQAARAVEAAVRRGAELGETVAGEQVWHLRALLALLRGDVPGARELAVAARAAGHPVRVVTALLAQHDGEPEALSRLLEAIRTDAPPWPDQLLAQTAVAAFHAGEPEVLDTAAGALAELAHDNPGSAGIAGAALLAGGLRDGKLEPAVEMLKTAHRPLLLALALEELGSAELARSDRGTGVALLDQARDLYAELGTDASALRVQRVLHSAGVRRRRWGRVPPKAEAGWDALTATERRVAGLVAEGHTNRSAAEVLAVSSSTVNTHLRAVFAKLGVNSRVQLARLVLTRDGGVTGAADR